MSTRPDASGVNPGQPYIRVALVHEPAQVEEALGRLVKALDGSSSGSASSASAAAAAQ